MNLRTIGPNLWYYDNKFLHRSYERDLTIYKIYEFWEFGEGSNLLFESDSLKSIQNYFNNKPAVKSKYNLPIWF